jgi:hypothetical protein
MDRHDVQNGIMRAWIAVESLELGETISNPSPLEVNEEFRNVILNGTSTYSDIFMSGLKLSHYNFLLSDYSFFQFSWSAPNQVRYAYYPNQFIPQGEEGGTSQIKRLQELLQSELITHEEYLSILRDAKADPRAPMFRYENAPDQHNGLIHPCSHFHIGNNPDGRWAINRVLTPLAFTLIIFKHFYTWAWSEIGADERAEYGNTLEAKLISEKANCRIIGDDLFLPEEGRSFFFG